MRAVVQRVASASVTVDGTEVSTVGKGLLVLVAVTHSDTVADARRLAQKVARLRIFSDAQGKMNNSVVDINGEVLVVSQFTLYGDCRKGNRPGFSGSAPGVVAQPLYEKFADVLGSMGLTVKKGVFGAHMAVNLVNDGPVTLILDVPCD